MNPSQIEQVREIANRHLENAIKTWEVIGSKIEKDQYILRLSESAAAYPSNIPGHDMVYEDRHIVDDFIALVLDMRNSSDHLATYYSPKVMDVCQLQRVYYETAVLLPSMAKVISFFDGGVTEYLGDGLLAVFNVGSAENKDSIMYSAKHAADSCLEALEKAINPLLAESFRLPSIAIGVGLALSPAVVTLAGLPDYRLPKVFGECVFRATKISFGVNTVYFDERLIHAWPKVKGGNLRFENSGIVKSGVLAYIATKL